MTALSCGVRRFPPELFCRVSLATGSASEPSGSLYPRGTLPPNPLCESSMKISPERRRDYHRAKNNVHCAADSDKSPPRPREQGEDFIKSFELCLLRLSAVNGFVAV